MFKYGIRDTQYLCPDHVSDFFVLSIQTHQIFPNLIIEETATLVG